MHVNGPNENDIKFNGRLKNVSVVVSVCREHLESKKPKLRRLCWLCVCMHMRKSAAWRERRANLRNTRPLSGSKELNILSCTLKSQMDLMCIKCFKFAWHYLLWANILLFSLCLRPLFTRNTTNRQKVPTEKLQIPMDGVLFFAVWNQEQRTKCNKYDNENTTGVFWWQRKNFAVLMYSNFIGQSLSLGTNKKMKEKKRFA